jgi:anti-sigma factor ChrR (cupin superfamily)
VSVHITADELAEAAAGMLDPARAAAIREHVAGCAACTEVATGLSQVPGLLAAEPAPTMPDDVFARLQAVVAAESERRAAERPQSASEGRKRRRRKGGI